MARVANDFGAHKQYPVHYRRVNELVICSQRQY